MTSAERIEYLTADPTAELVYHDVHFKVSSRVMRRASPYFESLLREVKDDGKLDYVPPIYRLPARSPSADCFLDLVQQLHDVEQLKITWNFAHERSVGQWELIDAFKLDASLVTFAEADYDEKEPTGDIAKWVTLLALADKSKAPKMLDILFDTAPHLTHIRKCFAEKRTLYPVGGFAALTKRTLIRLLELDDEE